jgi:molybdopterin synthase catalytic subunit
MADIVIRVEATDFDLAAEYARLAGRTDIGAIVQFIGRVRDRNNGQGVTRMTLEHYPGMTEKVLTDIAQRACDRWQLQAVTIVHRIGPLQPADQIVLVQTASIHREHAFAAAEAIMDFLKSEAPFWKREDNDAGSRWVEAHAKDTAALQRWN